MFPNHEMASFIFNLKNLVGCYNGDKQCHFFVFYLLSFNETYLCNPFIKWHLYVCLLAFDFM
jgi:hypothetical protein